jgi:hypothetical protein
MSYYPGVQKITGDLDKQTIAHHVGVTVEGFSTIIQEQLKVTTKVYDKKNNKEQTSK